MNALWIMYYDYEYIDKAINAGIDTLIVNAFDIPTETASGNYDSYEKIIECLTRYRTNYPQVKLFLDPIWVQPWHELPQEQQMVFHGEYKKFTPCIQNRAYIESRIKPALAIYKQGLCDGIIWDVEEYGRNRDGDGNIIEFFTEKNKCECPNCKDLSWDEQWKRHQDICKELLDDVDINGHFPTREIWGLKRYPNDVFLFLETTYGGIETWQTIKLRLYQLRNRILYGLNYKLVPGIWAEELEQDEFFKQLKLAQKVYGGYWIFAQRIFSQYSKTTAESLRQVGCKNVELVDDSFFAKLKEVNS